MPIELVLYLIDFFCNLGFFCDAVFLIFLLGYVLTCIIYFVNLGDMSDSQAKQCKSIMRKWWILLICALGIITIPNKSTMYLILGANYLSNSTIPAKVNEAISLKLDDVINEFKKEKKEK